MMGNVVHLLTATQKYITVHCFSVVCVCKCVEFGKWKKRKLKALGIQLLVTFLPTKQKKTSNLIFTTRGNCKSMTENI